MKNNVFDMREIVARTSLLFSLCLAFLAVPGFAQKDCVKYVDTTGGFSFCVPEGWTLTVQPGQKFKVVMGPASQFFVANINIQVNKNTTELRSYADAGIKAYLASKSPIGAQNLTLLSRSDFLTDSKERADKAVFREEYQGKVLVIIQYVIDTGTGKLHLAGTTLAAERNVNEKLFDASMKTFELLK
jgi:hypothetical protein